MSDYFDKPGVNIEDKTSNLEIFVLPIDGIKVEDDHVIAQYDKDMLNKEDWICREYILKNVGKTSVYEIDLICNAKKTTCIFDVHMMNEGTFNFGVLNYSEMYDRRVGPDETFKLKLCYNKDRIISGTFSAMFELGMRDDNGDYWFQPFFAPDDKLYESRNVSYKEYRVKSRADIAIECFKKPYMW